VIAEQEPINPYRAPASFEPAPAGAFVSQRGRARTLSWLLLGFVGAVGVFMVSDFVDIGVLLPLGRAQLDAATVEARDDRMAMVGLLYIAAFVPTAIVFSMFSVQANRNTGFIRRRMGFSPASMVWWYFVPIMNLVRPHQAFRELWHASLPDSRRSESPPPQLGSWWTAWVIGTVLGAISGNLEGRAKNAFDLFGASAVDLINCGAMMAAALLLRRLVVELADLQDSAYAERISATAPG
jgi:Domain of unknown function (DUF4328)